jgi:hypothetical protein
MFTARRRSQLTVSAALLVAILLLAGCDWAQFRYGPEHTGFNAFENDDRPGQRLGSAAALVSECRRSGHHVADDDR